MKFLVGPLQRLANLMEDQNEKIDEIHSVLTIDLKKASADNTAEFERQTILLTEIRDLLKLQSKDKDVDINIGRRRGTKEIFAQAGAAGLQMVTMSLAIAGAIALFSILPVISMQQVATIIAVAGIFMFLTPLFTHIEEAFKTTTGRMIANKLIGNKGMTFKTQAQIIGSTGMLMLSMALTITASAFLFSIIPVITPQQFATALAVSVALMPVTMAAAFILVALRRGGVKLNASSMVTIAMLPIIIPLILIGYAVAARAFGLFPDTLADPPPPVWMAVTSIVIAAAAWSFGLIIRAVRGASLTQLGMAALALPLLATSVLAMAYIFSKMPKQEEYKNSAPPIGWSLQTAAAILIMAVPFMIISTFTSLISLSLEQLGKVLLAMTAVSVAMVVVGMIFNEYNGGWGTPPNPIWAFSAAAAITLFSIPFLIVGKISQFLTPTGMLYGAAGMILIAGTMFVVGWIFSALPDLSAISKNFTDAIMYPMNHMIDALVRFKEEIGVENLLPLAKGLFAIAGGWLALTAAMAGQAAGGLFAGVANLGKTITDGLSKLFGGEASKTPLDLLKDLAAEKDTIIALTDPMRALGEIFARVSSSAPNVIEGMASILPFTQRGRHTRLQKSADALTQIARAYENIAVASTIMNVDAMNASTRMFDAIARIAEADGEDAMTVLAEQLMEAVEKLSETVKNLEDATTDSSAEIKDAVSGAIENFTKKIMGAKEEGGESGGMLDMSVVVSAIQELEARFDRPIPVEDAAAF
jgi:hypothetical protein